ncbi:phytoene desaturase family protein [Nocardioides sambongensis]|uniref:phytoene desaturase family protein n=1 Tax=Nocardioides sambongensis TaxID=2589074 RepID=UPI0011265458|nr:NAD(P)/FAD-dependent oxidoreductase [Nocardioides sambongensis]
MARTAVVVGSGPNGLTAGVVLARAGYQVRVLEARDQPGGGTRSAELTVPGLLHDVCSAAHPTGAASPAFRALDLHRHGLRFAHAPVEAAHVLDGGRAASLLRDLDATATGLGVDDQAWRRTFAGPVDRVDDLTDAILGPLLRVPRHPGALARFVPRAVLPATGLVRGWRTEEARALVAGMAAHAGLPLDSAGTSGIALLFGMLGHTVGWPVAVGGSQAISVALIAALAEAGGTVETGRRVTRLPSADLVLLDTSPEDALRIAGPMVPHRVARAYRRWRRGGAAYKIDLAVRGGVPWSAPDARRAGTVHVGGTFEEVHAAELAVRAGRMPQRPFVLVGQQYLADPGRSDGDLHPVWAYGHVPFGSTARATDAVLGQIERFAPGFRDSIEHFAVRTPAELAAENPNHPGGEIGGGAATLRQTLLRPRAALDPYRIADHVYLCSSSTSPGAGVHGMCGYHAARHAIADHAGAAGVSASRR